MQTVREALPRETIVACDPHLWGYWAREHFPIYEPRTFLYGLQFGTLGLCLSRWAWAPSSPRRSNRSLPSAATAAFLFTGQELATAVQLGINVPMVIFNDDAYGAIKEDFVRDYDNAYEVDLVNPDFVRYAEAFGAVGMRANPDELGDTLRRALELDRPSIIDVPAKLRRPLKVD